MRSLVVLALVCVAPSMFGQGAPSDVPKDHWAYHAVDELFKVGLLVGYPDGQFRGNRPVTRYELAASLDSLDRVEEEQIRALTAEMPPKSAKAQLDEIQQELQSLQAELNAIQPDKQDLDSLQQSMTELQKELADLKQSSVDLKKTISKQNP
jgi:peptidoglycan hydrolase CwlO-like protein